MRVFVVLVEWPEYRQTDFGTAELTAKRYYIRLVRADASIEELNVINNLELQSGERSIRVAYSLSLNKLIEAFTTFSGNTPTTEQLGELLKLYKEILNEGLRITGHAI